MAEKPGGADKDTGTEEMFMKKNGKRYRKKQKEKELKKYRDLVKVKKDISQEVGEINTAFLSMAHIVVRNPIVRDSEETKKEYLRRLRSYLNAGRWNRRKYEKAELCAYEKILSESGEVQREYGINFYRYFILLDLMHMIGYETTEDFSEKIYSVLTRYFEDFPEMTEKKDLIESLLKPFQGKQCQLKVLGKNPEFIEEKEYIKLIRKNLKFRKQKPFGVMVTATMSAGKSTFINALAGKYVCLSQNMACTSKIHCIVNKAFEDGYTYKYDHDLVMGAESQELLSNHEKNALDKIVISTFFRGCLQNMRIVVDDSPGVNFSGDESHKIIADRLLKGRNYNLLIYIMNATQLLTNDEDEHLDFVKQTIGKTPVIFIINKVDAFNVEEENVTAVIKRQINYLIKKGFKNPMVCPVSSKAGYLAKMSAENSLSRSQKRELYNYVDKFERMNLPAYYAENFPNIKVQNGKNEESNLLKTCGLAYIEKLIIMLITGGKTNDKGLCKV